jgi:cytochrome c oxidase assembly protein subunit 15
MRVVTSTPSTMAPEPSLHAVPDAADWRRRQPEPRRRALRVWLWSIALMTLLTLVIGGITRLTRSGLSIVDWAPIMGVVPPLSEHAWEEAFAAYRAFPEYLELRQGMSLSEFKFIFFWEYLHRLVARTIGLVFLVPFVVFAVRGYLKGPLLRRTLLLFALGGGQGLMGWFMVMSGLVDEPRVSHYRLAAHLSLAFVIFGYAVWLARELAVTDRPTRVDGSARALMRQGLAWVGGLLVVQILWGAFVAGLKAGYYYNTFPLMAGRLVPPDFVRVQPVLLNLVENPSAVQWVHRVVGTVLLLATIALFVRVRRGAVDAFSQRLNVVTCGLIAAQYMIGVLTLLYYVPVWLGTLHQAMAMIIVGAWLIWVHHVARLRPAAVRLASRHEVTAPAP